MSSHHDYRPRFGSHFKPGLTQLLQILGLDVVYERGNGSFLYYRDDGDREIEVLDMAGGYGSVLLGHSHPVLVAEAIRILSANRPAHAQGSLHEFAERLAGELSTRVGGGYCAVFANSGTEAVEAAIKHAMLETGSKTFVALDRAFHGQSLGALQLTASEHYRTPFALAGFDVVRVPPNDVARLEAAFASRRDLAGFIFEPILGEGGVRPLSREFARCAAQLCRERNLPLIADECQTGLGRTGSFLASDWLGIKPDYIILSKALGGGLVKIAALLISRKRYREAFDVIHTSTYADDDYSCAIALKTLELIGGDTLAACSTKGARLLSDLQRLRETFPDIVADVRGSGLMIGVEFRPSTSSSSFVLRRISAQEDLGLVLAAYLFAVHRIRLAPTLGSAFTLRLEPSALVDEKDLDRVVRALHDVCSRLRDHDVVRLTQHVGSRSSTGPMQSARLHEVSIAAQSDLAALGSRSIGGPAPSIRVAWLFHLIDGDDLGRLDGQFSKLPSSRREDLLRRLAPLSTPTVMSAVDVRSVSGATARLYPILLPVTSSWIRQLMDARQLSLPRSLVQSGVDLAHALGCQVVSLGQYTSIVTMNGTRVSDRGMALTTGNSFSAALAVRAVDHAHIERGLDPAESTLAVVGASGNIGRACAELLGPRYRRVMLVGSDRRGAQARLRDVARTIPGAEVAIDHKGIREANVVVSAINGVDVPLASADLARGAIVCDLSVPSSLSRATIIARPDVQFIEGGIARLPFGEDLGIAGFPLPAGEVYGCLAEAILLGLEGVRGNAFTGRLTPGHLARVAAMADRHGFKEAPPRVEAGLAEAGRHGFSECADV